MKPTAIITASAFVALLASGCATGPSTPMATLPASSIKESTKPVDGSAIAFQIDDGSCNKARFDLSRRMADGGYGEAQRIEATSSTFARKSSGLKQKKYKSSTKKLYARSMAPGDYVVTRIACVDSRSTSGGDTITTVYGTAPGRIDVFAEFEVLPGQTSYIGKLRFDYHRQHRAPTFSIQDNSEMAEADFAKDYQGKVAPMRVALAKRTGPGISPFANLTSNTVNTGSPRDLAELELAKLRVEARIAANMAKIRAEREQAAAAEQGK